MAFPQMKTAKDIKKGDQVWDGDQWLTVDWVNDWPQKDCVVLNFELGVSEPIAYEKTVMVRSGGKPESSVEMRLRKQLADLLIVAIPVANAEWAPRECDLQRLRDVIEQYNREF